MDNYYMYLTFIVIVKTSFLVLTGVHVYLKVKGKADSDLDKTIEYWKERLQFVFVVLVSILLIYLFSPHMGKGVLIEPETKMLLFLFGFFLLITANWSDFINNRTTFKRVKPMARKP